MPRHTTPRTFTTWLEPIPRELNEFTRYCDNCGNEAYPRYLYHKKGYCYSCMKYFHIMLLRDEDMGEALDGSGES